MAKLKSLIFREMRADLKNFVLKFFVFMLMSLFYIIGIYFAKPSETENGNVPGNFMQSMVLTVSAAAAMMAVFMNFGQTEILKSDIQSGWLMYSYALPIQAKDRALARMICLI